MPSDTVTPAPARPGILAQAVKRLHLPLDDPFAIVGLVIYAIFILVAIFADQLATHGWAAARVPLVRGAGGTNWRGL